MRLRLAALAAVTLSILSMPVMAEDQNENGNNFASDGGLGTTRVVQGCDRGAAGCSGFASEGGLGTTRITGDCSGQRNCSGFASDGGLGTTRIRDED